MGHKACIVDTIDPKSFQEFNDCYEKGDYEECDLEGKKR
jgi:hypothetical protein